MSWMKKLCETYENNIQMLNQDDGKAPLTPIAHIVANAQIEITINADGEFRDAVKVDKKDSATVIPVTEKSAGRSSGNAPHALCDNLSYIAGDMQNYVAAEKEKNLYKERFTMYCEALQRWNASMYKNSKAVAVYQYISKKHTIYDLIHLGLITCGEDGYLDSNKIVGTTYEKAMVRFRVIGDTGQPAQVWNNSKVIEDYSKYYCSEQAEETDICYITGENAVVSKNHPKGIVAACYGAKLISANDTSGFTFRGRFATSDEALAISYEASQKAHNALRWLAARQGYTIGTKDKRTYICWNPKGKKVPVLSGLFSRGEEVNDIPEANTMEGYKRILGEALRGYRNELGENEDIVIIGLDAATTGRLSVVYYNELKASDFLPRIENWYQTCSWYRAEYTDGRYHYNVKTPETKRIIEFAFGTERGNFVEVSDRILKEQYQRILHCMIDGERVPMDIIHALVNKASSLQLYSKTNRERLLSITCALITKHIQEEKKGGIKMDFSLQDDSRSFLMGRLLAIMDRVESQVYYQTGESRETNAMRLQSVFVQHPMTTWATLENALNPYYSKLKKTTRDYYKNLTGEIMEKVFLTKETEWNRPLDYKYLMGYYLQRKELYTFTEKSVVDNSTSENEEEK